jgi:hypothetical protein
MWNLFLQYIHFKEFMSKCKSAVIGVYLEELRVVLNQDTSSLPLCSVGQYHHFEGI